MSDRPEATILLVDDDETKRYTIAKTLRSRGLCGGGGRHGARGPADGRDRGPTWSILDVRLPDIDGFEVCRRIKSDPATRGDPGAARLRYVRRHRGQGAGAGERRRRLPDQRRRAAGADRHRAGPPPRLPGRGRGPAHASVNGRRRSTPSATGSCSSTATARSCRSTGLWSGSSTVPGASWSSKDLPSLLGDPEPWASGRSSPGCSNPAVGRPEKSPWAHPGCASTSTRSGTPRTSSRVRSASSPTSPSQKRLEMQLLRQAERLQEADRRKDEFLAMLAHELRNPLAPLSNALEIIGLPGARPPRWPQALEIARRQIQHMSRLLEDLLDVSRITRGKVELRKQAVTSARSSPTPSRRRRPLHRIATP